MPIPLITGPTAVGKSSVALALALASDGELLSCDSRQLYEGMDIGTAKPSPTEQHQVPHHLIDVGSFRDPWSAGRFAREAEQRLQDIVSRGGTPIVVGGSTLYIQALVDGLADIPTTDPGIRMALNEKLEVVGSEVLYEALLRVDPAFAATLDPTKSQRILRGLEVYASTGKPLSEYFSNVPPPAFQYNVIVLDRERTELYRRIDERVDEMLGAGLLDEVHRLMRAGYDPEANPLRTIGYAEVAALFRGEQSLEETVELIKRNSRRYAKRQLTWFRGREDCTWITIDSSDGVADILKRLPS